MSERNVSLEKVRQVYRLAKEGRLPITTNRGDRRGPVYGLLDFDINSLLEGCETVTGLFIQLAVTFPPEFVLKTVMANDLTATRKQDSNNNWVTVVKVADTRNAQQNILNQTFTDSQLRTSLEGLRNS